MSLRPKRPAPPPFARQFWGGAEWDFVFDVDIEEGAPPRKLALNVEDNPYIVADRCGVWL